MTTEEVEFNSNRLGRRVGFIIYDSKPREEGVKDPVVYLLLDCYVHFNVLYYIESIDLLMVGTPENVVSMGILLLVVYDKQRQIKNSHYLTSISSLAP